MPVAVLRPSIEAGDCATSNVCMQSTRSEGEDMSVEEVETLIIGGGQAGLAMSEHLGRRGGAHLIVERDRIAARWRSERWDSLVANGPAWHDRFPGLTFSGVDSEGFATPSPDRGLLHRSRGTNSSAGALRRRGHLGHEQGGWFGFPCRDNRRLDRSDECRRGHRSFPTPGDSSPRCAEFRHRADSFGRVPQSCAIAGRRSLGGGSGFLGRANRG